MYWTSFHHFLFPLVQCLVSRDYNIGSNHSVTRQQKTSRTGSRGSKRPEPTAKLALSLKKCKTSLVMYMCSRGKVGVYFHEIINPNAKHIHLATKIRKECLANSQRKNTRKQTKHGCRQGLPAEASGATGSLVWSSPIFLERRFSHFLGSGQIPSVIFLEVTGSLPSF